VSLILEGAIVVLMIVVIARTIPTRSVHPSHQVQIFTVRFVVMIAFPADRVLRVIRPAISARRIRVPPALNVSSVTHLPISVVVVVVVVRPVGHPFIWPLVLMVRVYVGRMRLVLDIGIVVISVMLGLDLVITG
jgi:hypothetical protein